MDFGVFVCSTCSGFHREILHKVKGVTMSNFSDKELEFLSKAGNDNVFKDLMGDYNPKIYPEPDKKDIIKMKEFFKLKYQQKRFQKKGEDSDSNEDESDSEDEKKKKKKKKEEKKTKKSTKSKKEASPSESDEDSADKKTKKKTKSKVVKSSESEDSEEDKKSKKKKGKPSREQSKEATKKKLAAPPGGIKRLDSSEVSKPKNHHVEVKKVKPDHQHDQKQNVEDLLGFQAVEKVPEATIIQDSPENWSNWATFQGPQPSQHNHIIPPTQVSTYNQSQQDWGSFQGQQQPTPQHNPNDLIKNLNNLYPQQVQQPKGFVPHLGQTAGYINENDPFKELIPAQQQQHQQHTLPQQPHGFQGGQFGQPHQNFMIQPGQLNQGNVQQQMLMMQQNMNNMRQQMGQNQGGPQNPQQMAMMQQMQQMMLMMQNMMMQGGQQPGQTMPQNTQQQQQQQVKKPNPQDNMFSDLFQSAASQAPNLKNNISHPNFSHNPFDQHYASPMQQHQTSYSPQYQGQTHGNNPFDSHTFSSQAPVQRSNTQNQLNTGGSNNPFDMFN